MKDLKKVIFIFVLIFFFSFSISAKSVSLIKLPFSYDLRDVDGECYITPVKSQVVPNELWNSVGLCWAFSNLASFESSLLLQGIVEDKNSPQANLSPWHIGCYIGYNHPNYEFNDKSLAPPFPVSYQLDKETMQLGWGGSSLYTIDFLSTGKGLVLEKDATFPLGDMKAKKTLVKPEEDLPAYYMLREGLIYERHDYSNEEEYRNAIKKAILKYGAMSSMMTLCEDDLPYYEREGFWCDDNYTDYYCSDESLVNNFKHAVAIVGWDDNKTMECAPGPGAWLIKDSMGMDFHDDGYLWISYFDTVFLKDYAYAVVFVADSGEGYSRDRYQTHEGAISEPFDGYMYESEGFLSEGKDSWCCARFIADDNSELKAVGLITMNNNENIKIDVYGKWNEESEEPYELVYSEDIFIENMGYHVVDLGELISLNKGQEFIIALGFMNNLKGTKEPLVYVLDSEKYSDNIKTYWAKGNENAEWEDWQEYSKVRENSVMYIQGILAE